jgi:hypothetical protein
MARVWGFPPGGTTALQGISIVLTAGEKIYRAHLREPTWYGSTGYLSGRSAPEQPTRFSRSRLCCYAEITRSMSLTWSILFPLIYGSRCHVTTFTEPATCPYISRPFSPYLRLGLDLEPLKVLQRKNLYAKCCILRCGAVWFYYYKPTFRRNVLPPSSG